MKNKKGFTLVELLAVIAILAILVIIALPNVINMYNRAQKQMFLTKAKKVYSESEKKYLTNAISGKNTKIINSEDSSKLDMTGKKLQYCVILNSSGKVTDMKVSNGKWVASLNGKALEDLTIDDLEDGNLDDYECASATDESCFGYTLAESNDNLDTVTVTIEDATKCKNYLMSDSVGAPEDAATTICNGGTYTQDGQDISIKGLVFDGIPEEDYETAGLSVKFMIEKVDVQDFTKCKNYLTSNFNELDENDATTLCTTNESVKGSTLLEAIQRGTIPYSDYENAGLKVVLSSPNITGVAITGYDTSCGTDVIIPSKINGNTVVEIAAYAFNASCLRGVKSNLDDDYKIKFLNYDSNDEYSAAKVVSDVSHNCISKKLTSVVIPETIHEISAYAFAYNELTEVIIPSSVRYIGRSAFYGNKLQNVTFDGNVNNIKINCDAFSGKNHSNKVNSIPTNWCNK